MQCSEYIVLKLDIKWIKVKTTRNGFTPYPFHMNQMGTAMWAGMILPINSLMIVDVVYLPVFDDGLKRETL